MVSWSGHLYVRSFMRALLALILAPVFLLAGCAHQYRVENFGDDPRYMRGPTEYDKPRVGWVAHGGFLSLWVTTLMSPSDWVPTESLRVVRTERSVTLCYSVLPRAGVKPGLPPVPVTYQFRTNAVKESEKREILVSRRCGKKT